MYTLNTIAAAAGAAVYTTTTTTTTTTIFGICLNGLFSRDYSWIGRDFHGSFKEEPLETAGVRLFLQAGCPFCHPTNSVKVLKKQNVSNTKRNFADGLKPTTEVSKEAPAAGRRLEVLSRRVKSSGPAPVISRADNY